jgi:hypothetical protein
MLRLQGLTLSLVTQHNLKQQVYIEAASRRRRGFYYDIINIRRITLHSNLSSLSRQPEMDWKTCLETLPYVKQIYTLISKWLYV